MKKVVLPSCWIFNLERTLSEEKEIKPVAAKPLQMMKIFKAFWWTAG